MKYTFWIHILYTQESEKVDWPPCFLASFMAAKDICGEISNWQTRTLAFEIKSSADWISSSLRMSLAPFTITIAFWPGKSSRAQFWFDFDLSPVEAECNGDLERRNEEKILLQIPWNGRCPIKEIQSWKWKVIASLRKQTFIIDSNGGDASGCSAGDGHVICRRRK